MNPSSWLLLFAGATPLLLAGCASRYNVSTIDSRTRELFAATEAPSLELGPHQLTDAETHLLEVADLESYVAFGLHSSAQLRTAFENWRASTERVVQVSSLPDPRLSFGEFLEQVQTRTGPQRRRIGLSQAFPWPGELDAKANLATRQVEAAWEQVEQARLGVVRRIQEAYYAYAFLARELGIRRELLTLVQGLEPVVQGRIRGGAGQEDLLRLQVELGRLEDDLGSLERSRPALSARLADAMNWPLESAALLPLPRLEIPSTQTRATAELLDIALEANPKLRGLERQLAAAESAEQLSAFKGRPNFTARVDYIQTGEALSSTTPGSGNDPLFVGFSMSLPVWRASISAAEREAKHRVRAARAQLDQGRSLLHADIVEQAYFVEDAQRRIELFQNSLLPRAREALQLTTASYRSGNATVLDLLDSERALLEFELSLWRACRAYLQGEARLHELLGGKQLLDSLPTPAEPTR